MTQEYTSEQFPCDQTHLAKFVTLIDNSVLIKYMTHNFVTVRECVFEQARYDQTHSAKFVMKPEYTSEQTHSNKTYLEKFVIHRKYISETSTL